jgi:DNA-binding Xre family transcriptional regulator
MAIKVTIKEAALKWQLKHKRDIKWTEISDITGIAYPTLMRLKEGNVDKVDLDKLNRLCKVFECEVEDLLVREDTEDIDEKAKLASIIEDRLEKLGQKEDDN